MSLRQTLPLLLVALVVVLGLAVPLTEGASSTHSAGLS
jgi:hypothetical protein